MDTQKFDRRKMRNHIGLVIMVLGLAILAPAVVNLMEVPASQSPDTFSVIMYYIGFPVFIAGGFINWLINKSPRK